MEHTPISPPGGPLESVERFLPTNLGIEPLSAVARALRGFDREQLGSAIEVLIALLDVADPTEDDPDFTPRSDGMPGDAGDEEDDGTGQGDPAYVEWTTMRGSQKGGQCLLAGHEDDEEDDAREDDDADSAVDDEPCDDLFMDMEPDFDDEIEPMLHDVPMLQTFSAEYNVFTDKRVPLGISNMQSSFITNGHEVRSADSGVVQRTVAHDCREPGSPV